VVGDGPFDLAYVPVWVSNIERMWDEPDYRRSWSDSRRLVLIGCYAKRVPSEDHPWAPAVADREREIEDTERRWGSLDLYRALAPSKSNDEVFERWVGRYFRQSASPKAAAAPLRMNTQIDVREIPPAIRGPTVLIYRTHDSGVDVDEGRYIADRIPGARFELPGADHMMWTGDPPAILDEIEEFLTGVRRGPEPDRVLATVLFTAFGSTELATRLGDRAWRDLLARHEQRSGASSTAGVDGRRTRPAMSSSRPSTAPPGRSDAPWTRSRRSADSGCRSGPGSHRRGRSRERRPAWDRHPHRFPRLPPRRPERGPRIPHRRRSGRGLRHRPGRPR
jgi:hypothetical protein